MTRADRYLTIWDSRRRSFRLGVPSGEEQRAGLRLQRDTIGSLCRAVAQTRDPLRRGVSELMTEPARERARALEAEFRSHLLERPPLLPDQFSGQIAAHLVEQAGIGLALPRQIAMQGATLQAEPPGHRLGRAKARGQQPSNRLAHLGRHAGLVLRQ